MLKKMGPAVYETNCQIYMYVHGIEALHGEVSIYLVCRVEFVENCLALFYYRGVDCSGVRETSQF